jgi:hypothetical protein
MKKLIILSLIAFSSVALVVTENKAAEPDYTFTNKTSYEISLAIDDGEFFDVKPNETSGISYKKDIGEIYIYLRIPGKSFANQDVYMDRIFVAKEPSQDITLGKKDMSDARGKNIDFTYKQPDLKGKKKFTIKNGLGLKGNFSVSGKK